VRNVSRLVAIGVNDNSYREIPRHLRRSEGGCEGAKEDKVGGSAFLKHLKERGLNGVRLIVSDNACLGLAESAAEFFPAVGWQKVHRVMVPQYFSYMPSTRVRENGIEVIKMPAQHVARSISSPNSRIAPRTAGECSRRVCRLEWRPTQTC
jgi:putative transposase